MNVSMKFTPELSMWAVSFTHRAPKVIWNAETRTWIPSKGGETEIVNAHGKIVASSIDVVIKTIHDNHKEATIHAISHQGNVLIA